MKLKLFAIFLSICFSNVLFSQKNLTLQECVELAKTNNINIQRANLDMKNKDLTLYNAKKQWLPSLNGSVQYGFQFGLSLNPTTNSLESSNSNYSTMSLSSNATLFNGGRIKNSVKQAEYDLKASTASKEQTSNDIYLMVVQNYLNILLSKEQITTAENILSQSQQQLERTNKLIEAGAAPAVERYQMEAQLATDEQNVIIRQNAYQNAILDLQNLLQLDPNSAFDIENPSIEIPTESNPSGFIFNDIYQKALTTQPNIQSAELSIKSSEYAKKIAQARLLPTLSVFGNVDTRYSSVARDFTSPDFTNATLVPSERNVLIDGEAAILTSFSADGIDYPRTGAGKQFNDNLGQSVGFQLSIPIFNRNNNTFGIEQAKLNIENAKIQDNSIKLELRKNILNAIADARSNEKQYIAAQKTLQASKIAFENAQKRYEIGGMDTYSLSNSRISYVNAETNLLLAKYNYLLALKIIDFYSGVPITLD